MTMETASGYKLLLMGVGLGTAFGLLLGPLLGLGVPHWESAQEPESDEPGMAKTIVAKIPAGER